MRMPRAVLLALPILMSSSVNAGYDNTEWGMTLAQVRALHPGGKSKRDNGPLGRDRSVYSVRHVVGGHPASVDFVFARDGGLREVSLSFLVPFERLELVRRKDGALIPRKVIEESPVITRREDAFASRTSVSAFVRSNSNSDPSSRCPIPIASSVAPS